MSVVCFSVVFGFLLPSRGESSQFREDGVSLHAVVDIGRERISSLRTKSESLCVCVQKQKYMHVEEGTGRGKGEDEA